MQAERGKRLGLDIKIEWRKARPHSRTDINTHKYLSHQYGWFQAPQKHSTAQRKMGRNVRCSFDIIQYLSQGQFQCPHCIRILRSSSSTGIIRKIHGSCPRLRLRLRQAHRAGTLRRVVRIRDIINDTGRMPRWRVEHHTNGPVPCFPTIFTSAVRVRLVIPRGALRSIPFAGGSTRLAPSNTTPNAPDLLDIVYSVRLFLEQKLIQMST